MYRRLSKEVYSCDIEGDPSWAGYPAMLTKVDSGRLGQGLVQSRTVIHYSNVSIQDMRSPQWRMLQSGPASL